MSACKSTGLFTGKVVFLQGVDNVFFVLFSSLHLLGILMTHNKLDSQGEYRQSRGEEQRSVVLRAS